MTPELRFLGDAAVELRLGCGIAPEINARVHSADARIHAARVPGLVETVPGYDTLLLAIDPDRFISSLLPPLVGGDAVSGRGLHHLIPVCYGGSRGPDLAFCASRAGMSERQFVSRHENRDYPVYFVGFTPGFVYLGGLSPELCSPRLPTPRPRVPAGSVAIGGAQTGIYSLPFAGGWRLIGQTSLSLFSPYASSPLRVGPGDTVRFLSVSARDLPPPEPVAEERSVSDPALVILKTSHGTTIQDLGRSGYRRWGVGSDGALDQAALAMVNMVVGNDPGAAGLEGFGPVRLTAKRELAVAVGGGAAGFRIAGRQFRIGTCCLARPGDDIDLPPATTSAAWYLAVGGGIATEPVMGSRSTGAVGKELGVGDALPVGVGAVGPRDRLDRRLPAEFFHRDPGPLRVIPGPDPIDLDRLLSKDMAVTPDWNRVGMRLKARPPLTADPDIVSAGVVPGTIQVPGDGQPILLLRGAGTSGGYLRAMTVITADLDRLTAFLPGTPIRFSPVDQDTAARARHQRRLELLSARSELDGGRVLSMTVDGRPHSVLIEDFSH